MCLKWLEEEFLKYLDDLESSAKKEREVEQDSDV